MRLRMLVCVAAAVLAAGCADSSGYEPADAVEDLVDAGLSRADAECVVDGLGTRRSELAVLNEREEPTPGERAQMAAVLEDCGVRP